MRVIGTTLELRRRARQRVLRGAVVAAAGVGLIVTSVVANANPDLRTPLIRLLALAGIAGTVWGIYAVRRGLALTSIPPACGRVVAALAEALPDDYVLLRHVALPHGGALADAIVLGPHGALVLSLKAMRGTFTHDEHHWYRLTSDGRRRRLDGSPTWEVLRPWKSVRRLIRHYGYSHLPVTAAIVLASGSLAPEPSPSPARGVSPGPAPGQPQDENGTTEASAAAGDAGDEERSDSSSKAAAPSQSRRSRWRLGRGRPGTEMPVFPVIAAGGVVGFVQALPAAERVTPEIVTRFADLLASSVG